MSKITGNMVYGTPREKINYKTNVNINNCNKQGTIYDAQILFNDEQLHALVFPVKMSPVKFAQFAFTSDGKILCRKTDNGAWSYKDADDNVHKIEFEEIGGIS